MLTRYPVPSRTWLTFRSVPSSSVSFISLPDGIADLIDREVVIGNALWTLGFNHCAPAGRIERGESRSCTSRGSLRNQFGRATTWLTSAGPTSGQAYRIADIGQVCRMGCM